MLSSFMPLLPKRVYSALQKRFIQEERGLGTIEMIILVAVLVGLAIAFKSFITDYFDGISSQLPENV